MTLSMSAAAPVMANPAPAENPDASRDTNKGVTTYFGEPAKDAAPAAEAAKAPAAAPASAVTTPAPAAPVAAVPPSPAAGNGVVDAVRAKLSEKAFAAKAVGPHADVLKSFYAARTEPLWLKDGALTANAVAAIAELKKADSYGLDASQFAVAELAAGASVEAQAEAEANLGLAILKYAHHARGGRIDPLSLSNILDMKPPLKDPVAVMTEIAASSAPDAYLRGLHPKHSQFALLRAALEKARGPQVEEKIDEALLVKLPEGKQIKTIKPGETHDDIALLRKRLKVEAQSASNEKLYDAILETAVKGYQEANGIKANGQLTAKTRQGLNKEGEPKKADPKRDVDRIIANMERWRWLPEELGPFYVINNVPEFVSRTVKGDQEILKQKIIVGQPSWPTPVLTSNMQFVIFNPEWGVPDGIKVKELLPRLKKAAAQSSGGAGGFFDQLFGGGTTNSGGSRVMAAYKLNPTINGKPVNADQIDWNKVDIRQFSFVQPAGAENPLGVVKFRFPNRHDVYMHDTSQRSLFNQSYRALSHGCMRVDQPRKFAEILLAEDKGWSAEKVSTLYAGSTNDISLSKPVPVHVTYFTARVNEDGKLQTFADLYGHDERVNSALQGRAVKYYAPDPSKDDATISDASDAAPQAATKKHQQTAGNKKVKKNTETAGDILSDALSGLLAN
ncbi:MAG: L,D-transpeptidase family protein [Hyphomicrobium sp.]|nr:L,D-transpeptidase family protein [Hyphomicrobium sp.]